jgi:hypothetical protein
MTTLKGRSAGRRPSGSFAASRQGRLASWILPGGLAILIVSHGFLADRLYIAAGSGGRGFLSVTAVAIPVFASVCLLMARNRTEVGLLVRTRRFWTRIGFLALVTMTLPVLGVLVMGFPGRSLFASTEGAVAVSAAIGGFILRRRTVRAGAVLATVVGIFCGVQLVAALSQMGALPANWLPWMTEWDTRVRVAYGYDQVVSGRAIGTLINPNTMGLAAALGVLYASYFLRGGRRASGVIAGCLAVLLSQSRGALLALVVSTVVVWIAHSLQAKRRGLHAIGLGMIAAGLIVIAGATPAPQLVMEGLERVPGFDVWASRTGSGLRSLAGGDVDESVISRYDAWSEAAEFSKSYPLGTLGPPQLLFTRSIDNDYIRLWCQGSLLGVSAFLLVILSSCRPGQVSRESMFAQHAVLAVAVAAASAIVLGTSPAVLMWLGVGLALGADQPTGFPNATLSPVRRPAMVRVTT